jgi:hypothetical protein
MRTRQIPDYSIPSNASAVYGSKVASQFLQDLVAGRDSLDIVCIGDSNIGSDNYGYTHGFNRVLNYSYGVPWYATPLFAGSCSDGPTTRVGTDFQPGVRLRWCGNAQAGSTGTVRTLVEASVSSSPVYTYAQNLKTALGFDTTNYSTNSTRRLPIFQWGVGWYGAYVDDGVTYTSTGNNNLIELSDTHPMNYGSGTGGAALAYRIVAGTFNGGSGQFKLRAANNSTLANLATTSSYISSNTGTDGYANASQISDLQLNFNSPSTTPTTLICSWDGMNSGNSVTGPFACLYHSIIRQSGKGFASNTLMYQSGRTPTLIADQLEYSDKLIDAFIKELRERQIVAGGSGRVLVVVNMGINGSTNDNGVAYIAAANRIIGRVSSRWISTGGSSSQLAFVFTVTHPSTASGNATWNTNRPGIVAGVNAWAAGAAGNTCVVDIGSQYGSYRLNIETLYQTGNTAHLNATTVAQNNGYDAMAGVIVSSLIASV